MALLDAVMIDGRFRLCCGGTNTPALVAADNPIDRFQTRLDPDAAALNRRVWLLERRATADPPGFINKGQALRCAGMLAEAGIKPLSSEEVISNE